MSKRKQESLVEERGQGHNSFSKVELTTLITQIEGLLAERKNLSEDIRAAMDVAAQKGFDKRAIREMLKLNALDPEVRQERESLRDMYMDALELG